MTYSIVCDSTSFFSEEDRKRMDEAVALARWIRERSQLYPPPRRFNLRPQVMHGFHPLAALPRSSC